MKALLLARLLLALTVSAAASCASTASPDVSGRNSGAALYQIHCASCHGRDGHGNGPVAPLLKLEPPDLTKISARRGGEFPAEEVYRIIDGQSARVTHATRNMPIWGFEFFGDESDDRLAHERASQTIDRLVAYLESIQSAD